MSTDTTVLAFAVQTSTLKGVLMAASDEDIRYYLNGIYADTERQMLVATDGHVEMLARHSMDATVAPFVIPREAIENILKLGGKQQPLIEVRIAATRDDKGTQRTITLTVPQGSVSAPEIDGRFPDYARVIPTQPNNEPAQFNPALLARLQMAFSTVQNLRKGGHAFINIRYNGPTSAALIACSDPNYLGVLMPWRVDEDSVANALSNLGFNAPEPTVEDQPAPAETVEPAVEAPQTEKRAA